ncbi:30S ribosomal protein S5 [Candidatus Woesearchaeota archaeon]|nr:30S ribosomal protein S5 [Candidatus Woesearchaeota archaeon]
MPKKKITKKNEDLEEQPEVLEPIDEESPKVEKIETNIVENWTPKTELGKKVKSGEITNIDQIIDSGRTILEPEIVDSLLPELESELLLIGQAKGKFGGGQRRIFRQTQKKTREGNKPKFTTMAVVGNKNGYIGLGLGKSKETVPAREKAIKNAKLNIFKISRGSGSWASNSKEPTSIPYAVQGKVGSVQIKLMPAPKGKGLCVEKECAKILALAGIKDIWAKSQGQTKNKINLIKACEKSLKQLIKTKTRPQDTETLSIQEGRLRLEQNE